HRDPLRPADRPGRSVGAVAVLLPKPQHHPDSQRRPTMRSLPGVAIVAAAALILTACASGADEPETDATPTDESSAGSETEFEAKDPLTIGYSVYDLQNPYWQAYAAGVEAG